jgi:hypothetical protein
MTKNPHISALRTSCRATLAAILGLLTATAHAQPLGAAEMPIDILKTVYLECERAAVGGALGSSEVMQCSVVYEELKRRAFGGDFRRLKAWSDVALAAALSES